MRFDVKRLRTRGEMDKQINGAIFPFWDKLTSERRAQMVDSLIVKKYSAHTQEAVEKFAGESPVWIVSQGKVRVFIESEEGQNYKLITLHQGESCGAFMALGHSRYYIKADIEADTQICIVKRMLSKELLLTEKSVQIFVTECNAFFCACMLDVIGDLVFSGLKDRLFRRLQEYMQEAKNGEINITHEELASELGTSREVISRILKNMAQDGSITLKRKKIILNHGKNT